MSLTESDEARLSINDEWIESIAGKLKAVASKISTSETRRKFFRRRGRASFFFFRRRGGVCRRGGLNCCRAFLARGRGRGNGRGCLSGGPPVEEQPREKSAAPVTRVSILPRGGVVGFCMGSTVFCTLLRLRLSTTETPVLHECSVRSSK